MLLTASAALVAADQGHSVATVMPIAGNRAAQDHRTLVSTLSQDALFVLRMDDVPGPDADFTDLLAGAWPAALAGYRAAAYDPADWDALLDRAAQERGTEVHPYCCFNDMRLAERPATPVRRRTRTNSPRSAAAACSTSPRRRTASPAGTACT